MEQLVCENSKQRESTLLRFTCSVFTAVALHDREPTIHIETTLFESLLGLPQKRIKKSQKRVRSAVPLKGVMVCVLCCNS